MSVHLPKIFHNFNQLLNNSNAKISFLTIPESRIKNNSSSPINLQLDNWIRKLNWKYPNWNVTLPYMSKILSSYLQNDLKVYNTGKTESIFTKIIASKSTSVILGCIHKHPTHQVNDFRSDCFSPLFLKLQKSVRKEISYLLLPHLPLPTWTFQTSKLIDNIFSTSTFLEEIEFVNSKPTSQDHLPNILFILKDFFSKLLAEKSNILRDDWKNFESNKYIPDFDQTDWEQILCKESDVNFSMNQEIPI